MYSTWVKQFLYFKFLFRRLGLACQTIRFQRQYMNIAVAVVVAYKSNVKSVLLYGCECWRVIRTDMKSLSSFHHNCFKQICKIFWPNTITNTNLLKLTNAACILNQIRQKRLRWLGHVLSMDRSAIPKIALRWTPAGKRPRGRPKTTWRKTIENEMKSLDLTWGEAEARAKIITMYTHYL